MASKYIKLPVELAASGGGVVSDVNVLSSALPTGASTSAQQTSTNTKLDSVTTKQDAQTSLLNFIETDLQASNTSLSSINTKLPSGLTVTTGRLQVELPAGGTGLTNTELRASPVVVSGSVTTGGLTDAQIRATPVAVSGTVSTGALTNTELRATAVPVSLASTTVTNTVATTLASTTITGSVAVTGPLTDTQLRATPVAVSGSVTTGGLTDTQLRASAVPVSLTSTTISSSALPTGASTSALQTSGNSTLTSIDAKTPALGQALSAASTPVVLTAAQISTLTPLTSVTVTQAIGTNLHTVIDSGSVNAAVTGTVSVSNFPASQAVSGTVTVANPGLTDTQLRATALPVSLASTTVTGSVAVTGPLTDTQLRALAVPVSLASTTVTNFPATQAVSIASSVAVTGPLTNTELRLTPVPISGTVSTGLAQPITDTQLRATALPVSLASTTITGSVATTLASTTITNFPATQAVTGTFFQATQPVSAIALPLPTGASTETTLSALNTKIPSGLVVTTGRLQVELPAGGTGLTNTEIRATALPVSLASTTITGTVATSSASLPLPTGAATSANQTAANASLSSIDTKLTSPLVVSGAAAVGIAPTFNPVSISGTDAGNLKRHLRTDAVGRLEINTIQSLPLPTGAASSANQTTTNASLSSVDGKTPALGQALAAASTPVVLTAAQVTTLTPLTSVGVNNFPASQAVTGTFFQATQPVAIQAAVVPADISVAGNLTSAADSVILSTSGESTSLFEVGGTWVGTFIFESSNNNFTTFQPVAAVYLGGLASQSATFSAPGFYSVLTAGFQKVRIRFSVYTSGTATILANASAGNRISVALQGNPQNLQTLATQGPAGATAWKVDGSAVTQPVSIASTINTTGLTDTQLRATAVPVSLASTTVTNTVATTLASTTITGSVAVTGALTDTQIRATPLPVSGTVAANATLTAETTKVIGTVNIAAAQTLSTVTTVSAVTAITNALPAGTNSIGTFQPPAITKGTQGTIGITTQALNDAGRNPIHYYTLIPVITTAIDTLQNLTGTKAGATVAATTTPAVVTAGKTFRVTRLAATYISTAVSGYGIVRLRHNTAGVVTITSPLAATLVIGNGAPVTANAADSEEATISEGWEFAAATGIGISVQGFAAVTATAVGYVMVSITGYEY